jgi:HSP20 family protein
MLTRWNTNGLTAPWFGDPLAELGSFAELRRQMDRIFEDIDATTGTGFGAPRFELHDGGEALEVRAQLPGFRHEDIDIQIERRTITIRGSRQTEVPPGYVAHRRERGAMEVARAFTLPCRIDPDRASAVLRNGVLRLTLPKVPEEQPRKVDVRVEG